MKLIRTLSLSIFALMGTFATLGLAGCEEKSTTEKAGDKIEDAGENIGDKAEDVGDKIEDKVD